MCKFTGDRVKMGMKLANYSGVYLAIGVAFQSLLLACGADITEGAPWAEETPHEWGRVDLALVQAIDNADLADGDTNGFRHADVSKALVNGRRASDTAAGDRRNACFSDPRVQLGLVDLDTCLGAELFFREGFGGNGRTCGSCHPANNNFTLDERFIESLDHDDALFVAEHQEQLAQLEQPDLLREFGLVTVNPDGFEAPTSKFTMRSVSHIFSMATSITAPPIVAEDGTTLDFTKNPPVHRLGWGGDGSPGDGSLRQFAQGAIEQHATKSLERRKYEDFLPALGTQLDHLERFQLEVGRKNELDLTQVSLADSGAERGRTSYLEGPARRCNTCHSNAGANNIVTLLDTGETFPANFTFTTNVELTRHRVLNERRIPLDGGFGSEPLDINQDGIPDLFGRLAFNAQSLIEAADTGPFFHTHSMNSIEDAIRFYTGSVFGTSPSGRIGPPGIPGGPIVLSDDEVADLGRFLRILNAAFNVQITRQRLHATLLVTEAYGNRYISVQRGLLRMARVELDDALEVLGTVEELSLDAQDELHAARRNIGSALRTQRRSQRVTLTRQALLKVEQADSLLGSGMEYDLGEGTLLF